MSRRIQILDTAAALFAERGFHGVSVHDIGAACGISGPAIYKHFAGKDAILTESLTSISERHVAEASERRSAHLDPGAALDALIAWHIDFALEHPALIVIQEREWTNLDPDGRDTVRRLQLVYIDIWVDVLRGLRDDLDAAQARAVVQATFGLLNSTPHSARISPQAMRDLLGPMARSALLSPAG
ncbi:MAG: TetR/AcrR family transcriptional regulator [Aeromicrobium sp.]|uniref:TetR/AcrR family transcriptional regulator n=1 Tax=Aeromicrobium sp. TaxID=1871063 RepID=UPI003C33AFA5